MSLLREIQDSAIDSKTDLASLLRKCKVLAVRLGSEEFKSWVDSELSGYKNVESLPAYRVFDVNSKGHFTGPFGSGAKNADIPLSTLPEKWRNDIAVCNMMDSVASIEALVISSDGHNPRMSWNPDFVALVGGHIYSNMICMQAWKVIPITGLIEALSEIRNRILNFVLEIEAQDPAAGEASLNSAPVPAEKVQQIFNTYISGSVQNVATGSHSFEQHAIQNEANAELFNELLDVLNALGQPDITKPLCNNIEEMRASQGTVNFKAHYQQFVSLLADHVQVLGPVVAPFLPALAAILP